MSSYRKLDDVATITADIRDDVYALRGDGMTLARTLNLSPVININDGESADRVALRSCL